MPIELRTHEGIAWVTLNRPDKLNALNRAMLEALAQALDSLEADSEVGVLVILGSGDRAFAAGGDIAEFRGLDFEAAQSRALLGQALMNRIEAFPKPVIAAVQGWALGGGCELAMACHLRIASSTARFGLPEASIGLIPGYGGTQRLARLVGRGLALDMLLTGEPIDALRAKEAGLVSRVFPAEELRDEAERIARTLLARAPLALAADIAALHQGLDLDLVEALQLEAVYFARISQTEDAREGTAAFVEKRPPVFKGC